MVKVNESLREGLAFGGVGRQGLSLGSPPNDQSEFAAQLCEE